MWTADSEDQGKSKRAAQQLAASGKRQLGVVSKRPTASIKQRAGSWNRWTVRSTVLEGGWRIGVKVHGMESGSMV